jgi:hypothetical protein
MNSRKTVFIAGIGVIVAIVLLILIALLSQLSTTSNNSTTNNTSLPVSNPNVNIIDLNNPIGGAFEYAVVKPDDTIELRNKMNEKFIIGLEKRNWRNLQWSPNGELVAVLGRNGQNFDIYIYDIVKKQWSLASDYRNFSSGVDSFTWVENNTLLYTQGEVPNRWLHRYNYISKETLKISNIIGDISNVSNDNQFITIKSESTAPIIYDNTGTAVQTLDNIKDSTTNENIVVEKVRFFDNTQKILALTNNGYYKFNLGDNVAVKTSLTADYKLSCSLTENSFGGYLITSNRLSFGAFSSREDLFNILGEQSFKLTFEVEDSFCHNGSIYLKLVFADNTTQWYKQTATVLEEDGILGENSYVDIIDK